MNGLAPRYAIVAAVVGLGVFGAVAGRALIADGAYALWYLVTNGVPATTSDRLLSGVTSLPAFAAMKLGVRDIPALVTVLGVGQIVLVTAVWALALVVVVRTRLFWIFVVAFAVVYLNGGLISVGDYNLAYALVALAAAVLLLVGGDRRPWHAIALLICAVLLLRMYESMAFLGPLLVVLAVVGVRRDRPTRAWRVVLWLSAGLFAVGTVLAVWTIIVPRDPRNRDNAANLLRSVTENPQLVISALVSVLFVVALLVGRGRRVVFVSLAIAALPLAIPALWARPGFHYDARVTTGILLLVLLAGAALVAAQMRRDPESPASRGAGLEALVPLVLLLTLSVPFAVHTVGFARWLGTAQDVLATSSGPVFIQGTALEADARYYAWSWTHPYLSVLLRPAGSDAVLQPSTEPTDSVVEAAPLPEGFRTGPTPFGVK